MKKMNTDKNPDAHIVKASEFKAKCIKLMDEVARAGTELIVSKNGRPVVRLLPYQDKPGSLFGIDRGKIEILGDVVDPLDVEWEANALPATGAED